MKTRGISLDLQSRVRKFIEYSFEQEMQPSIQAEQILIERLNESLIADVKNEAYGSILEGVMVLKKNFSSETLKRLTNFIKITHYRPGEVVIEVIWIKWNESVMIFYLILL